MPVARAGQMRNTASCVRTLARPGFGLTGECTFTTSSPPSAGSRTASTRSGHGTSGSGDTTSGVRAAMSTPRERDPSRRWGMSATATS